MGQVKDYPGLVKDPVTGVVKNTNYSDLKRAKMAKKRILDEINRQKELEERVDTLESKIDTILELLTKVQNNG